MRVITGTARGRRLQEPSGRDIRPTTDMVKEAIFNIVQFDIEGKRVLDLFAGTGQLGIEALSRGAREAVFVDRSREAGELIRKNLTLCGLAGRVETRDSLEYLESCGRFGLIFLDPPYDGELAAAALQKIHEFDILSDGGIIICETDRRLELPELPPYEKSRDYRYGKIKLNLYKKYGDI